MKNPYEQLPDSAFWRSAVSGKSPFDVADLWVPKWPIDSATRIATFGSCFAQYFGEVLRAKRFGWVDAEAPPSSLPMAMRAEYGYGVFSARTGNIYTTKQLRQWFEWSFGVRSMPEEFWFEDGRVVDPFRPSLEPHGFVSIDEATRLRRTTLRSLLDVAKNADLLVFTLGLTEGWSHREHGYFYQSCPGTIAGRFSADEHRFVNATFAEMTEDLEVTRDLLASVNPDIKILLTVSPVPLTATASGNHILVAKNRSKALLGSVANEFSSSNVCVDYFPSYELITAIPFRSMFYEPNLRNVSRAGVEFVMGKFFSSLASNDHDAGLNEKREHLLDKLPDPLCDDQDLDQFATDL